MVFKSRRAWSPSCGSSCKPLWARIPRAVPASRFRVMITATVRSPTDPLVKRQRSSSVAESSCSDTSRSSSFSTRNRITESRVLLSNPCTAFARYCKTSLYWFISWSSSRRLSRRSTKEAACRSYEVTLASACANSPWKGSTGVSTSTPRRLEAWSAAMATSSHLRCRVSSPGSSR